MSDHKHHHHKQHHNHNHTPPGGQDWGELGAQLELQAEILSPILDEAVSWLRASADGLLVGRIIDIGCGPGVATTTLASAFPEANVLALEAHLTAGALHMDWAATLSGAGFEVLVNRTALVDLGAPLPEQVRRWIAKDFARTASMIHDKLSAEDQATLAILLDAADPRGLAHRADLGLHAGHALFVARKPTG